MINNHVLVIDDNDLVRASIRDILQLLDMPVITASNGQSGVDLYAKHSSEIGLVLLDLTMPRMDGTETLRALRKLNPEVRVVILSAHSHEERVKRLKGEQPCGFLNKPFEVEEMLTLIRTHCPDHGVDS